MKILSNQVSKEKPNGLRLGPINQVFLLGGGALLFKFSQWLKSKGLDVTIVTAPRHADEQFPHLGDGCFRDLVKKDGTKIHVLKNINDQKETNLHNVSSWFDQKPRLLLELWVLIGGVFVPLGELRRGSRLTPAEFRYWFWPTMDCLPVAGLAILVRLPERLKELFDVESMPLEIRYSEPQEYYFAMFLMLYLASLAARKRGGASES